MASKEKGTRSKGSARKAVTSASGGSAKKRTTTKKKRSATPESGAATKSRVTIEERRSMIAEAAYLRAASRDFRGGDPTADWLEAERQIDRLLGSAR